MYDILPTRCNIGHGFANRWPRWLALGLFFLSYSSYSHPPSLSPIMRTPLA